MKIAVAGSACTGKTTLVNTLAERLKLPVIDEGMDTLFDVNGQFISPKKRLADEIIEITKNKKQLSTQFDKGFVEDRSPLDLLNIWLSRGLGQNIEATQRFAQVCRAYAREYDLIVLLPWGVLPLEQLPPATRRKRVMNAWVQFYSHSTLLGILVQFVEPACCLPVPEKIADLDQRLNYVLAALDRHR